ncbi:MAG TPA: hypothetical protein VMV48_05270 [Gallionellaceae bacterium]|nr:hypothetical protein [Gallionellaceae bacterium]
MKNLFNLDFRSALKRIFGSENRAEPDAARAEAVVRQIEDEIANEAALTLTIWTIERSRYAASRALCTDIEVYPSTAVALCEDILGYVFDTPSGESVVIEARTGSLVGHTLEVVRDGVREMTKSQLNTQLDTAKKEFNRMNRQALSNDEFWKTIKMGSSETEIAQDYQE